MHRKKESTAEIKEGMLKGFMVFALVLIWDSVAILSRCREPGFPGKRLCMLESGLSHPGY
jgi:hypothetical protein